MKVEKIVHRGYQEWIEHRNYWKKAPQLFGKWQYLFSNEKKSISLVQLYTHWALSEPIWEAAWIRKGGFDVIGVWKTKKEAIAEIERLLK